MLARATSALALLALSACGAGQSISAGSQTASQEAGTVCLWAIYTIIDEAGKRCFPGQDPEFQAFAAESARRLDQVMRERGGMDEARLAEFKRKQTQTALPDADFCKPEGPAGFYLPIREKNPDELRRDIEQGRRDIDKVVARKEPPAWGDCI